MKYKTIKCPFCDEHHAHITYEESRVYQLNCTECPMPFSTKTEVGMLL